MGRWRSDSPVPTAPSTRDTSRASGGRSLSSASRPSQPAPQWLSDHLEGGGRDKEHHDWGQDQSEVEYLIEKLTQPGELVVEPFCGGGSVPAAAKKLGRRWIATEIDETTALIARKRLSRNEDLRGFSRGISLTTKVRAVPEIPIKGRHLRQGLAALLAAGAAADPGLRLAIVACRPPRMCPTVGRLF